MKIFWDGSVSLFPDTQANENNKALVNELLRVLEANEDKEEPIYTLAHGNDTQVGIQSAFAKIKLEALEAKESQSDSNEQSSMQSTFAQDTQDPAIFNCNEGEFTLRLLQGDIPHVLLNMDSHPKKTPVEYEEDLAVLEDI